MECLNPVRAVLLCLVLYGSLARADEGMWTFDHFPAATVADRYGVTTDARWLDHLRAASVRLTSGCSASVVSKDGLVLTNHHCVVDCVQTMSTAGRNYVAQGFLTRSRAEEQKCPGMQAEVLRDIAEVTPEVTAAIAAAGKRDVVKARDAAIAALEERSCKDQPEARCEVVTLYQGGQYKLYKYRKYSDVRLVFAPEFAVSFFGGDPDNFNFPRFCLDSAFVRLYEGGKPAAVADWLEWRRSAPQAGEPVFVSGNPGATSRMDTLAQLDLRRDWRQPTLLLIWAELRGRLLQYSAQGPEQARTATDLLFRIENSYKGFYGRERALMDPEFYAVKVREERELRARVAASPTLAKEVGDPWAEISRATDRYHEIYHKRLLLESMAGAYSQLYRSAVTLVRGAEERAKPSGDRLREYSDTSLPLLEAELLDPRPVYPDIERITLELALLKAREYLTVDSPEVRTLLGRESPQQLAGRLVGGSRLGEAKVREQLWKGGQTAIAASDDPMIRFVRATDANARAVRQSYEQDVEGPVTRATERIARARFAVYADALYPDATFTLRLSFGSVQGWTYQGRSVAPVTNFGGLYERATGVEPFALPKRWLEAKGRIDPATPLDLSATVDIIGGNSGSPLVDASGRVLGAIFDGNIHSLGGDFGYDGRLNRAVAVSSVAITTALRKVYGVEQLADELEGAPR